MSIFELFQVLGTNIWLYGGVFLIVLSILVFVHEWGHYIVARWCGVRVEIFSIGFGKEIFGFTDKSGTRWKFSLIPLGGYVKLFGDVDPASVKHEDSIEDRDTGEIRHLTDSERKVAFFAKPVWRRAAIVIAGPAINYIFAILILCGLFVFSGQPVTPPNAGAVIVGSSADKAGFLPHDRIISIDGETIQTFEDIRRDMMIALDTEKHFVIERDGKHVDIYTKPERVKERDRFGFEHSKGLLGLISPAHAVKMSSIKSIDGREMQDEEQIRSALEKRLGQRFKLVIDRGGETDTLIVEPLKDKNSGLNNPEDTNYNVLFLSSPSDDLFLKYGPVEALGKALEQTWVVTTGTLEALGQMVMGTRSAKELGGIIRMGALAGDMAQQGLIAVIMFIALLSINLGLINLFPIPMLDGGHLLFYAVEAIIRKPIPDRIQEYAFQFGLVFLVGIMVFANLNDLMQLIL